MANRNLSAAKKAKNDEFYTRFTDINSELKHYEKHFKDKIVYCNCDDGQWSNFWKFFYANFEIFEMKKLIATSYHDGISHTGDSEDIAYKYVYEGGYGKTDFVKNNYMEGVTKTRLEGNGDFRSEECIEILKESDIVVTNPPFSLFREFVGQLEEYNKKYAIIGSMNANTYKEIFPLIKENKLWHGYNYVKEFLQPDGTIKTFGNIHWFTNLDTNKRHHIYECYSRYNETDYPKYDNYDAIEVGKVCDIPCDYTGVMGVPITFLDKHCPEQFDIIGLGNSRDNFTPNKNYTECKKYKKDGTIVDGNAINSVLTINIKIIPIDEIYYSCNEAKCLIAPYARVLIRWKPEAMPHIYDDGVILYE